MRGLGERIRLMLEYMKLPYEDIKYYPGAYPNFDRTEWESCKYKLGLDFPNLPYIIDGDLKMTESWAIMRYLARKNNNQLYPELGMQEIRCDMAVGVIHDFRTNFTLMIYNTDFHNLKVSYVETLPQKLEKFDKFLLGNKWLAGEKLTYADFALAETLLRHEMMFPGCLDHFKNLKRFHEAFQGLDAIKSYHESNRFMKFPMHLPYAQWGHGP